MSKYFIKANSDAKIFIANEEKIELAKSDLVLFENEQCQEVGVVVGKSEVTEAEDKLAEATLIRKLSDKDIAEVQVVKKEATETIEKCKAIVEKHSLPMMLLDAELSYDRKKLTFYFTAPGRVDFRGLVSELASTFQKLIRLQQVGTRERAKCMGGIGRCGMDYCCKKFLKGDLDCVNTEMANEQNLGQMGPARVTGACGKLMCCLRYESDFYKKAKEKMPKNGEEIKTAKGVGKVIAQNVLKKTVTVLTADKNYVEVDCSKSL
jgi:cell fate regulator YaaT (PSP1 superfamily)